MNPGDVILINFPFTIPTHSKARPAVVITTTADRYADLVACAISSVIPASLSANEIFLSKSDPSFRETGLRVDSVIKVDRIATLRQIDVITRLGECDEALWNRITERFKKLVE